MEIRNQLTKCLLHGISLEDFEDWLVSKSWNMHLDSAYEAQALASAVELDFSEYSSGSVDVEQLRRKLALELYANPQSTTTGAGNVTIYL